VIAIDTNIISGLMNGSIRELPAGDIFVPYIVQAEIYFGVSVGSNPAKYKPIADAVFGSGTFNLSSGIGQEIIGIYVQIASYVRKNGTPVSPNDLWIAAECISLDLSLLTLDKDFMHIPQLAKV
jgi:predicted nucleic acid-binding protein